MDELCVSDVLSCNLVNDNNVVRSFKVNIYIEEREKLLDTLLWSENIIVMKYY